MLGCESNLTQNQPHWHRLAQVEAIAQCDANKRRWLCWLLHRLYCWSIRHLCGHLRHDRKSRILAAGHARPPVLTFPVREADHTDLLHRALPFVAILYCAFFQTDPKTECKDCLFIIRVEKCSLAMPEAGSWLWLKPDAKATKSVSSSIVPILHRAWRYKSIAASRKKLLQQRKAGDRERKGSELQKCTKFCGLGSHRGCLGGHLPHV